MKFIANNTVQMRPMVTSIANMLLLATLLVVGAACTKKAETGTVRLVMPTASATAKTNAKASEKAGSATGTVTSQSGDSWNSNLNPTVGTDVNCYAVFIGGGDLTANSCTIGTTAATATTIKFGPNVGFIPAGGEVVVETPAGPRVIYVVGLHAGTAAACASYQNSEPDSSNLSDPFLIAAQSAIIPSGVSSVTIAPTLDTSKKVLDCKFINSGGGSNSAPFGDKRDGVIASTSSVTMNAASSSLSSVTSRSGNTTLPDSKIFASSRRISSIATAGAYPGAAITTGTPFTSNDFDVGDEVAWYIAGGASSIGSPDDPVNGACGGGLYLGRFGTARIKAADFATSSLTLDRPLTGSPATLRNSNLLAGPTTTNFCTIVLSRVSSFEKIVVDGANSLTMAVEPFNYTTGKGGFLMIRADAIFVGAGTSFIIDGNASGYAGGIASASIYQGDGVNSAGSTGTFANYNGGAPGTLSTIGGGGGGHVGSGGQGAAAGGVSGGSPLNHCMGGTPCSPLVDQKVFMGGGGGGAGSSELGGNGGGVVILYAGSITGTGNFVMRAAGAAGVAGSAGTGAGAGGAIGLTTRSSTLSSIDLSANGGIGGSATVGGGGGGGGVVNVSYCSANFTTALTTSVFGGAGGPSASSGTNGLLNVADDPSVCSQP
jgi:hypothetical protein